MEMEMDANEKGVWEVKRMNKIVCLFVCVNQIVISETFMLLNKDFYTL